MIFSRFSPRRPLAAIPGTLFAISAAPVAATTLSVTSCVDETADVSGSLRYAIAHANSGDEVDLSALSCSVITLAYGPVISYVDDVTLAGSTTRTLTIDGAGADRVLIHNGLGTMTVGYLTISHGHYAKGIYGGGCIYAAGNVTLYHSTVSNCDVQSPATKGGGIYARGSVTLKYSTVDSNKAGMLPGDPDGVAAGIYVYGSLQAYQSTISRNVSSNAAGGVEARGDVTLVASTLTGNNAPMTSAIQYRKNPDITLTIKNSTITGNVSNNMEDSQAIFFPNIRLYNSTVAKNTTNGDGAVTISATSVKTVSSIIAGNYGVALEIFATTLTGNSNIIGSADVALPGDTIKADPQLHFLADNGGPTRTLALAATSPAIDAGDNPLNLPTDQRGTGFPRVVGKAPDIGAFEYRDDIFANGFE